MNSRRCRRTPCPPLSRRPTSTDYLNEPGEAESICRDVLEVDPDNQDALITLLLALTDQFDTEAASAAVAEHAR